MERIATKFTLFVLLTLGLIHLSEQYIANTQEFQVQLTDSDWDNLSSREATINEFLQIALDNLNLDLSDFTQSTSLRRETRVDIDDCETEADGGFIRYRQWFSMDNAGLSSLDLKIGTSGMSRNEALDAPGEVSNEYEDIANQDSEEDVHYCEGSDFARSSKVFFENEDDVPNLDNCGDLRDIFPGFFNEDSDNEEIRYSFSSETTYYIEYNTEYEDGTLLRMQFNLEYPTSSDAMDGTNFEGGEFSFTLWSPDEGRDYPQNPEIETSVRQAYNQIIQTFGSPGSDDCNSSEFSTRITSAREVDSSASLLEVSPILILILLSTYLL